MFSLSAPTPAGTRDRTDAARPTRVDVVRRGVDRDGRRHMPHHRSCHEDQQLDSLDLVGQNNQSARPAPPAMLAAIVIPGSRPRVAPGSLPRATKFLEAADHIAAPPGDVTDKAMRLRFDAGAAACLGKCQGFRPGFV